MRFATSLIALVLSAGLAVPAMAKDFVVGQATLAHGPKVVAVPKMLAQGPRKYTLSLPTLAQFSDGSILTAAQLNALLNVAVGAVPASQVGIANGVAALDGDARVPSAQMPLAIALGAGSSAVTQTAGDNTTAPATDAFVVRALGGVTSGVSSFQSRTGSVTLQGADVTTALGFTPYSASNPAAYVSAVSPAFSGTPTAPTASNGTNTTQLATTGFVQSALANISTGVTSFQSRTGTVSLQGSDVISALGFSPYNSTNPAGYVSAASPTFTGTPSAPTAAGGTNSTQLATTGFVQNAISGVSGTFSPDNSMAKLSSGLYSASGLINIMALAGGIPINDYGVHTIGNAPTGSIFHGLTTLAQVAALNINGITPFSFLTDNGSVTGPACTPGSSTNCFTSASGSYKLTNASVPSLDIAWLAAEGAEMTAGGAYAPGCPTVSSGGCYVIGSSLPLTVMLPMNTNGNNQPASEGVLAGDSKYRSKLQAGSSFGSLVAGYMNLPLVTAGDPSATASNQLGRYAPNGLSIAYNEVHDISVVGSTSANAWTSPYLTDGIAIAPRMRLTNVTSYDFYNDFSTLGDHTDYKTVQANGGECGMYWAPPNSVLVGDQTYRDFAASGAARGAMCVDGNASVSGEFDAESYLNAQGYNFYGYNNGCAPLIGDAHFERLMMEETGLGFAIDDHVFNGGTYTDGNKCRSIQNLRVEYTFPQFQNSAFPSGLGRVRRAAWDVTTMSGYLHGISDNGGTMVPIPDPTGSHGIAIFNLNGIGDSATNMGFGISGDITGLAGAAVGQGPGGSTIPFFNAGATGGNPYLAALWSQTNGTTPGSGGFAIFNSAGNVTQSYVGDAYEFKGGTYGDVQPAGVVPNMPVIGVAAQNGITNGQVVMMQQHGYAFVNTGYSYGFNGFEKKSQGVGGRAVIAAGSGGTNGTYAATSTGGGCSQQASFNIVVSGGQITQVNSNFSPNPGSGPLNCTSAPTVPVTGVPGLSGGSVTLQWPAAGLTATSSPQDGVIFAMGLQSSTGSTGSGTQTSFSRLIGMQ